MTKRELWLKLFSENNTALAAAIHLCERFATPESLNNNVDFLAQKRRELDEEVDLETIEAVFPGYLEKQEPKQVELTESLIGEIPEQCRERFLEMIGMEVYCDEPNRVVTENETPQYKGKTWAEVRQEMFTPEKYDQRFGGRDNCGRNVVPW